MRAEDLMKQAIAAPFKLDVCLIVLFVPVVLIVCTLRFLGAHGIAVSVHICVIGTDAGSPGFELPAVVGGVIATLLAGVVGGGLLFLGASMMSSRHEALVFILVRRPKVIGGVEVGRLGGARVRGHGICGYERWELAPAFAGSFCGGGATRVA